MSIRVGMIGYQFMGRAHSIAYRNIPFYFKNTTRPVLQTLCGRNSQNVSRAASEMGWSSSETEWEKNDSTGRYRFNRYCVTKSYTC